MKLKILELFGGIGACSKALERLGIDYEIVDYVEIDKYAVKSFNAIHNTNFEPQDITTWDKNIEVDLICGGFPCQDISLAGKQKGIIKGETRSGLMYEMMRIIKKTDPKYIITENVKNLLSDKFRPQLEEYLCFLSNNGYEVTMDCLNSKDYGIPQNRERIFIIGVKNENI
jgi:DNA (cytosine-5)-methyltransferase 1